jgi:hypothetical protein
MMAKTAAERQAKYRAERPYAGSDSNGERRLNMWLSTAASLALVRLARRYCVTKREIIERLVIAEDARISASIDLDSPEWDKYFGIVPRYAVTAPQVLHPAANPIHPEEKNSP